MIILLKTEEGNKTLWFSSSPLPYDKEEIYFFEAVDVMLKSCGISIEDVEKDLTKLKTLNPFDFNATGTPRTLKEFYNDSTYYLKLFGDYNHVYLLNGGNEGQDVQLYVNHIMFYYASAKRFA